jgi:putative Mg2+ transporter-C (MgtC) family protein
MTELSTLDILFRLVIAAVLSAVIGFEREHRNKPAGIRTNILVGLGTAVATIASLEIGRLDASGVDVSRLVSSILPGIGFIGAGSIIRAGGSVRGLTTAASVWVVAAVGIASGLGMFTLGFLATVLALVTLIVIPRVPEIEDENK